MHIAKYSRYKTADNKRYFVVLGTIWNGFEVVAYQVLELNAETELRLAVDVFEKQIAEGKMIRIEWGVDFGVKEITDRPTRPGEGSSR